MGGGCGAFPGSQGDRGQAGPGGVSHSLCSQPGTRPAAPMGEVLACLALRVRACSACPAHPSQGHREATWGGGAGLGHQGQGVAGNRREPGGWAGRWCRN